MSSGEHREQARYDEVLRRLSAHQLDWRELKGAGRCAVTPAGGRVIAWSFDEMSPNLLWANPALADESLPGIEWDKLPGSLGGDRLWFAPERLFHWRGKPDWDGFSNYNVPDIVDPGHYVFIEGDETKIALMGRFHLEPRLAGPALDFTVERSISLAPLPSELRSLTADLDYAGFISRTVLRLADDCRHGRIGLWHLLQLPAGTTLIVPYDRRSEMDMRRPVKYGGKGGWRQLEDRFEWRVKGTQNAKVGISASAVTGRCAALLASSTGVWTLVVRQFPLFPGSYIDHPYGEPRDDIVVQAWDGGGFGELEHHSRSIDAAREDRLLDQTDALFAFRGRADRIRTIGENLLGIDIFDARRGVERPGPT